MSPLEHSEKSRGVRPWWRRLLCRIGWHYAELPTVVGPYRSAVTGNVLGGFTSWRCRCGKVVAVEIDELLHPPGVRWGK